MANKRTTTIYPSSSKELKELGQRLKDARLRRKFSMETVCARADISRPTLYKVENGEPSVAIGIYVQVLRVLGMTGDLSLVAKEDALGRRLQDESLSLRKRAPKIRLRSFAGNFRGSKIEDKDG
ncbi:MAG: helix-turn-helix transcriptional regulator [Geobacteraceae bacterium]|nr:helix-turn-helix transcriptional regulator [Geobacteraceae bacterium]